MTIKYWRISILKHGEPVTLFATTTDDSVDTDLGAEGSGSLIATARQYHRHPQTQEQNHRDLAIGAIMAHARPPVYDCDRGRIEAAPSVPDGKPTAFVGGGRHGLVPIWEESDASNLGES